MDKKIRVLVVDDAVIIRQLLADTLAQDPALEVVGTAANGKIALDKLPRVNPDVVILDIEMPVMNGLDALKEIRAVHRRLPVIMFSSMTERGAAITLDALALGASDYFTKPAEAGGVAASLEVIRTQLIPKIKALCGGADSGSVVRGPTLASPLPTPKPAPPGSAGGSDMQVVAIGASTGGPAALTDLLGRLPAPFPVPIVIVQHMPPVFTRLLAERLSAQSKLRVREGSSGMLLQPGEAWLAPGDFHMIVIRDGAQARLLIHQDAIENSCRPAVDVLFRSVAAVFGSSALAVMLTGMGQDGMQGCMNIRKAGGVVLSQDEASSVVWGMPGNVARAGLADMILPIPMIADELARRTRHSVRP